VLSHTYLYLARYLARVCFYQNANMKARVLLVVEVVIFATTCPTPLTTHDHTAMQDASP
jgi:hypothetical protein